MLSTSLHMSDCPSLHLYSWKLAGLCLVRTSACMNYTMDDGYFTELARRKRRGAHHVKIFMFASLCLMSFSSRIDRVTCSQRNLGSNLRPLFLLLQVLSLPDSKKDIDAFVFEDLCLEGYKPHAKIAMQMAV